MDKERQKQAIDRVLRDMAGAMVAGLALVGTRTGLFRAKAWVCNVPDLRKAEAVKNALEGPISESCPASLVRRHPNSYVFLDPESASLLSMNAVNSRWTISN